MSGALLRWTAEGGCPTWSVADVSLIMIPALRQQFNANYTPEKYQRLLKLLEERCGTPVKFRVCETPCFLPRPLLDQMCEYGKELVQQLNGIDYRKVSSAAIPEQFKVPHETAQPLFVQVDFGLVRDQTGRLQPKLVELQGFPSLYAYQAVLSRSYEEVFGLDRNLKYLLGGLDWESYKKLLCRAIVADHDPAQVVLMEIDPWHQKTLPDFLLTEKLLGVKTVDIAHIRKVGKFLFYEDAGKLTPIKRIYNRAIVDEMVRKDLKTTFRLTDDIEVEWAGHPNWFFRLSKFSLPYLRHECVPKTWFLDRVDQIPKDLENYVVKPTWVMVRATATSRGPGLPKPSRRYLATDPTGAVIPTWSSSATSTRTVGKTRSRPSSPPATRTSSRSSSVTTATATCSTANSATSTTPSPARRSPPRSPALPSGTSTPTNRSCSTTTTTSATPARRRSNASRRSPISTFPTLASSPDYCT